MSESDELIRVLTKRIAEQIDMDNISNVLRVVANEALKLSVDTSGIVNIANQTIKALHAVKIDNECVPNEVKHSADQLVSIAREINDDQENIPNCDNLTNSKLKQILIFLFPLFVALIPVIQNEVHFQIEQEQRTEDKEFELKKQFYDDFHKLVEYLTDSMNHIPN